MSAQEIKETLGSRWNCAKADDARPPGMVTEKIVYALLNSDLVIAIVADPRGGNSINPNVMYELGIAHSFRRPAIVVADSRNDLPFDIRSVETIQLDFSNAEFLVTLRKELQRALRGALVPDYLEKRRIPLNPITAPLSGARIFIEDLPWLWGYCEALKRGREASMVWVITRDLYWAGEPLFFAGIKDSIRKGRKHYLMVENDPGVLRKVERIKNQLLQQDFSRNEISGLIHFVAIERKYFLLWPISIVLYDADLVANKGGIICEPMQSQVGNDPFDTEIRQLFLQDGSSEDLDIFEKRLLDLPWTVRRKEATFDISLDGRIVDELATSFAEVWNEKILEEAQQKTGDEKSVLLNTWVIGG